MSLNVRKTAVPGVRLLLAAAFAVAMIPGLAEAQFAGSNLPGPQQTIAQSRDARVGDRVTVTGFQSDVRGRFIDAHYFQIID